MTLSGLNSSLTYNVSLYGYNAGIWDAGAQTNRLIVGSSGSVNPVIFNNPIVEYNTNGLAVWTNITPGAGGQIIITISLANSHGALNCMKVDELSAGTTNVPPVITQQPTNVTVIQGSNATFSVTVSTNSTLPLSYQWYLNTTNLLTNQTSSTLTLTNVQLAQAGNYMVVVSNVAGSVTSSNAVLTVNPATYTITATAGVGGNINPSGSVVVASGANQSFTITTNAGYNVLSVTVDGVSVGTPSAYTFSNVTANHTIAALFTNVTVPVVTSFSPQTGNVGTVVSIGGLNFDPVATNNVVYFGVVRAVVSSASSTNLVVTVPVGATFAPVTETVNGLVAYSGRPFQPTFFGNGSGIGTNTFGSRLDLPAGQGAVQVVIADLDGDGKPDLVVANNGNNTLSIYRNIGTNQLLTASSFGAPVILATPAGPYGLVAADIDGDGKLDIIVSDSNTNLVSVYRNTCTPGNISSNTFATRVDFTVGTQPQGVAVADIDGDGRPDILVANAGDVTLSILRNTGVMGSLTTNSFAPKIDYVMGGGCCNVSVGDLDGDGIPDVVTANANSNTVSLLRNISTPGNIAFGTRADFIGHGCLSAKRRAIGY